MSNIQQLIPVSNNEQGINVVNARDLHTWLESKQHFSIWIKSRIEKYGFVEGEDYVTSNKIVARQTLIEYAVTLDMAKELAMVENNERGREARKYFIECERVARLPKQLTAIEQIQLLLQATSEQHQEVAAVKQEVMEVRQDVQLLKQQTTLTTSQQRKVQRSVGRVVAKFRDMFETAESEVSKSELYAELYREIKNRWGVGSYRDLPCVELDNVLAYVEAWRPRMRQTS